jgi:septal ring factor EnvC (AmiA/AmiB activator)
MTSVPDEMAALRRVIREAHEALTDLRAERRELEASLKAIKREIIEGRDELIANYVKAGLDRYEENLRRAIDDSTAAVQKRFDTLADILMGVDRKQRDRGATSLEEMIRGVIEQEAT